MIFLFFFNSIIEYLESNVFIIVSILFLLLIVKLYSVVIVSYFNNFKSRSTVNSVIYDFSKELNLNASTTKLLKKNIVNKHIDILPFFCLLYSLMYKIFTMKSFLSNKEKNVLRCIEIAILKKFSYIDFESLKASNIPLSKFVIEVRKKYCNIPYEIYDDIIESAANIDFEYDIEQKKFLDEFKMKTKGSRDIYILGSEFSHNLMLVKSLLINDFYPICNKLDDVNILKIEQNNHISHSRIRNITEKFGVSDWVDFTTENVKNLHIDSSIEIELQTNFLHKYSEHTKHIFNVISDKKNIVKELSNNITEYSSYIDDIFEIVYIVNLDDLETGNNEDIINYLSSINSDDKVSSEIVFLVNGLGFLDTRSYIRISNVILDFQMKLRNLGFKRPIVIPFIVEMSLLIRSALFNLKANNYLEQSVQEELLRSIKFLYDNQDLYKDLLENCSKNKKLLAQSFIKNIEKYGNENYIIAGEVITGKQLVLVESLTGISLLEEHFYHNSSLFCNNKKKISRLIST